MCAPGISNSVLEAVDKSVSNEEFFKTPEKFVGKSVLLGGTTIQFESRENRLIVLQSLLDIRFSPMESDATLGRFLVVLDTPIKDEKLVKGAKISIFGKVEGKKRLPLQARYYYYLVVRAVEYHVWLETEPWGYRGLNFGFGVSGSF